MGSAKLLGNRGEKIANQYLLRSGYKIVGRNLKLGRQEIDIIAQKIDWTIFVEVKTRTLGNTTDNLLSRRQLLNLKRAMVKYALKNQLNFERLRLDLILITVKPGETTIGLNHYRDILN